MHEFSVARTGPIYKSRVDYSLYKYKSTSWDNTEKNYQSSIEMCCWSKTVFAFNKCVGLLKQTSQGTELKSL